MIWVRKARIGWWVDGRWCPTRAIRDHEIRRLAGSAALDAAIYYLRLHRGIRIRALDDKTAPESQDWNAGARPCRSATGGRAVRRCR